MRSSERDYPWLRELRTVVFTVGHYSNTYDTLFKPRMTREHIEDRCKMAVDDGFNAVIPSIAHFRWDFIAHLDEIERYINDLVEIGHKHGLKVWDHYSLTLMNNFVPGTRYKQWQFDQITKKDFRDGSHYRLGGPKSSVMLCCENPYFKELSFDLIRRFAINSGIDVFMPDDMNGAMNFYDCACPHCRRLFKELTGYETPEVGNLDPNFFNNIENPAWRAWIRLRATKVARSVKVIREFLDSEGRSDLPMTTCNSDSLSNYTRMFGCDHEEFGALGNLDMGFHEMHDRQPYFWPRSIADRQTAIGTNTYLGIPTINLSYTMSNAEDVFAHLINLAHGQCYISWTGRDAYVKSGHLGVNHLAQKHTEIFQSRAASNVAVVFSRNTRDFYGKDVFTRTYIEHHTDELAGWCEFAMRMNYPFRVIPESQVADGTLDGIDVLILPNCACMSEATSNAIREFVANGGTVIATNETSLYDAGGVKQEDFALANVFGLRYISTHAGYSYSIVKNTAKSDTVIDYGCPDFVPSRYDPAIRDVMWQNIPTTRLAHHSQMVVTSVTGDKTQVLAHSPIMEGLYFGHAAVTVNEYGSGRAIYFAGLPGLMCHMIPTHTYSQYGEDPCEYIPALEPIYGKMIQNTINLAVGDNHCLKFDKVIDGMYVNLTASPDGSRKFVHINSTPKWQLEPDGIHYKGLKELLRFEIAWPDNEFSFENSHEHPESWGPDFDYVDIPALELTVGKEIHFDRARLAGIEFEGWKDLSVDDNDGLKTVRIPEGLVGRYAFVELS